MRQVTIALPDGLYAELREVSKAAGEPGYGPAHWAGDLIASELASRRLPRVAKGRLGARVSSGDVELKTYRAVLPEKDGVCA